ncbi:hypothetical protein KR054_009263, partial [Drosophila jambulina]
HQSYFSLQQQQQQQLQQQQQHLPSSSNSSEVAASGPADLQFDTLNNNNNNNNSHSNGSSEQATNGATDTQKRRSLLNFKSLDFHLKSLYSGLRSHTSTGASSSQPNSSAPAVDQVQRRMPYLRVESVDPEGPESERLRRTEALSGHSPSFLSPYTGAGGGGAASLQLPSPDAATIRRSSTSDIVNCKKGAAGGTGTGTGTGGAGVGVGVGAQDTRRPSTSDLLRRARERKGSEARMGRSVS